MRFFDNDRWIDYDGTDNKVKKRHLDNTHACKE